MVGARLAIKVHSKTGNVRQLQHDLRNGPNHVFGDHSQCNPAFCKVTSKENDDGSDSDNSDSDSGMPWCHFVLWTPKGVSVQTIEADPEFWASARSWIIQFYNHAVLPEFVLPQYRAGQPICEPFL